MNLVTVISGPGSDLALLTKTAHVLIKCTVTGGGLTKDHVYQSSADGTSWLDITLTTAHDHSSNTMGGAMIDMYRANSKLVDLLLTKTTDLRPISIPNSWVGTATLGGTVEDTIDGTSGERSMRLRPNATSGGAYTLTYPHLRLDFSKRSFFQCKTRIEGSVATQVVRSGVNADPVTAVDTNVQKYCIEVCTATNLNWQLRTASGSNKSMSDTGTTATTSRTGFKLEHLPDSIPAEVDAYIATNAVFQKTSDIPTTGASVDATLVVHSCKNSAAADKPYHVFGSRVVYYTSDNWV